MTSAKFSVFVCIWNWFINTAKFRQPPLLDLLFHDSPPPLDANIIVERSLEMENGLRRAFLNDEARRAARPRGGNSNWHLTAQCVIPSCWVTRAAKQVCPQEQGQKRSMNHLRTSYVYGVHNFLSNSNFSLRMLKIGAVNKSYYPWNQMDSNFSGYSGAVFNSARNLSRLSLQFHFHWLLPLNLSRNLVSRQAHFLLNSAPGSLLKESTNCKILWASLMDAYFPS